MKRYCFDTSGVSNPIETMPEDIHKSMWLHVTGVFAAGAVAVTTEIYDEMVRVPGAIGSCIKANKSSILMEVNEGTWNWKSYLDHSVRMNTAHREVISEYCGNSAKTVCLNDMSIIALAKCLGLPVVSMEVSTNPSTKRRRIPDICKLESVDHLTFNQFLRLEKITL